MSATVNVNVLKNFIIKTLGGDKLDKHEAQSLGIKQNEFLKGDVDVNSFLDLDEILEDKDLYAQFATLYVEEQEKESAEAKSEDQEKEEQTKIKDKSEAKAK